MKKAVSAIPVAAIFGILALLFVFMCLPQKQSSTGAAYTVDLYFLRTRGLYCAVLGGILMAAFYHLTLYVFRRRETVYLLFSIFCLASVLHFLFARGGLNEVFHWIPAGEFLTRFSGVLSFVWHNTITIVGLYVLSQPFLLAHKKALAAYIILGIAYYCFMPADTRLYGLIAFFVILAVSMFVTAVAFKSPVLRENRWTLLYFISFVFYICSAIVHNVILAGKLFMPVLVGNLFMVLSQSVLLSKNYTDAFLFVEETNVNLEQIVGERTKSLQDANEAMQSTNTAMKELVSNISHDLKTPLAVMSVNLETLSGMAATQNDADFRRHVRTAYQKNLDLQRLIQNLFEVSRIETGRSLYAPKWESLLHLLVQAREKYDGFLEDNGIQLDIDVEDDIQISTDPQKVWSVFDNIIYNAARHTESGGSIKIAVQIGEASATVTITDTGCGIAAGHLPHIFERFYKASKARGEKEGDSGLGLYIVKSVMEGCGGSVKAESESGKGTSVILTFPAKPAT